MFMCNKDNKTINNNQIIFSKTELTGNINPRNKKNMKIFTYFAGIPAG